MKTHSSPEQREIRSWYRDMINSGPIEFLVHWKVLKHLKIFLQLPTKLAHERKLSRNVEDLP